MDSPTFSEGSFVHSTPPVSNNRIMREEIQKIVNLADEINNIKVARDDDVTLSNLLVSDDQRTANSRALIRSLIDVIKYDKVMGEEDNIKKIMHEFFGKIDTYADTVVEAIEDNYSEAKELKPKTDFYSEYLDALKALGNCVVSKSEMFDKLANLVKEDYKEVRLDLKNVMKMKLNDATMDFIKNLLRPHIMDTAEDVWVTVSEGVDSSIVEKLIRAGVASQRTLSRSNKVAQQIKLVTDI